MNKKVLLIADDEEMNRRVVKKFLDDSFEIHEAKNGREVIEILDSMHIDGLLLDIMMPEMDGLEVLKELRGNEDRFSHLAILVATSYKEKTERMALSLGADDVVPKPYDPIVIQKRLENLIILKCMNNTQNSATALNARDIEKLSVGAETIKKYGDIIEANTDNPYLIATMAKEVKKEAENIETLLNKKEK